MRQHLSSGAAKFIWGIPAVALLALNTCFCIAAPPSQQEWIVEPELSDEFNGNTLDERKWDDHNPQWRGRVPGLNSPQNISVKDGYLTLLVRKEVLPENFRPYRDFTTSAVKSKQKVLYGYFEVRAKPMKSRVASAFWFYDNQPDQWTEIDVFELGPGTPGHEYSYHMNAHVFRTPTYKGSVRGHMKFPEIWLSPQQLSDEFHVYGLEWDEKKISWYVDGKVVRTLDNAYWHYPVYMNFDTEVMPDWFGIPTAEEFPQEYKIDYVRSWRRVLGSITNH